MFVTDKAGVAASYGWLGAFASALNNHLPVYDSLLNVFDYRALTKNRDGVNVAANAAGIKKKRSFVSAPSICNVLTGCEKIISAC